MRKLLFLCAIFIATNVLSNNDILSVPSDPKTQYTVIQKKVVGDLSILQTIRKGSSGISFATRLFNCKHATFKYLVTVDGKENMNEYLEKNNQAMDSLNASNMYPLIEGSISYYAYKYSCE